MSHQQIFSEILRLSSPKLDVEDIKQDVMKKSSGYEKNITSNMDSHNLKKIKPYYYFCISFS